MSTLDRATILRVRAESIKNLMERAERRGDDCHEMDNIRHCAHGVLELIECDPECGVTLEGMVSSLERRSVELFKKRYSNIVPK